MSVPAARVVAQAKVNLALRVGPRRPDGYHELATIFARIELADDVVVRVLRTGVTVTVRRGGAPDESVGPPERNLALRAAHAYMSETQWPPGCAIDIEKRIPVGAGLGGGSADAAAVLRALESLSPSPVGIARLTRIGASLGADVPFLALGSPLALGTGRGDVVEALEPLPPRWLALVQPSFSVSTADAYAWLDADRGLGDAGPLDSDALRMAARDWAALAAMATNDLQEVVVARYPLIERYCEQLRRAGARLAMMSGSGSAVFGLYADEPDVAAIERACHASVTATRVPARVVAHLLNE
ncbi:MAG TPA: 4-(cytidine 5'-diphospho)-2-C-methyl-D-erythritol kinase [Gemmatimonadaceae bacterium]|nr:4-(cytidine 5'-diphospho)-2-C-methyl-D-erythritol kinase [Gemmatimonadaceae bacterium]